MVQIHKTTKAKMGLIVSATLVCSVKTHAMISAVENDNRQTEYMDLTTLSGSKIEVPSSCGEDIVKFKSVILWKCLKIFETITQICLTNL